MIYPATVNVTAKKNPILIKQRVDFDVSLLMCNHKNI